MSAVAPIARLAAAKPKPRRRGPIRPDIRPAPSRSSRTKPSRKSDVPFSAREALRRAGGLLGEEARAQGQLARNAAPTIGLGAALLWAGGGLITLILLRAMLSNRGPSGFEALTGGIARAVQILADPADPIVERASGKPFPETASAASAGGGSGAGNYPGRPRGVGGHIYPLGRVGRIIGTPGSGTHSRTEGPNNWESDNAIDIGVPVGTPVLAVETGVISGGYGLMGSDGGRFNGSRLHLVGDGGTTYYYAHLSSLIAKPGERVRAGQVIGYTGAANGVAHLHFATDIGNPLELIKHWLRRLVGTPGAKPLP